MTRLPQGWVLVRLGEVADHSLGKMLDRAKHTAGQSLPYLRNINVQWDGIDTSDVLQMYFQESELDRFGLRAGDLLICEGGEPGRCAIWTGEVPQMKFQKALHRVRPSRALETGYLRYRLKFDASTGSLEDYFSGSTIRHFTGQALARYEFPLPPLNEQRRIVAKIDALMARSRQAKESLDAIPALLERLRQSILAAAFRGDLTADWRAQNPDVEPATSSLKADLPLGWHWRRLEEIIVDGPRNGYSPRCGEPALGPKVLKLSATSSGRLELSKKTTKRACHPFDGNEHAWAEPGDLLIQRANTIELVGTAAIYDGPANEYVFPDLMMRVRVPDPDLAPLVCQYINGSAARTWLRERATGTAGNMPKINGKTLRSLPVPVPPLEERKPLLKRLRGALHALDLIGASTVAARKSTSEIDRAILAKAFRGELVPQDPSDEPAELTLARLRATAGPKPKKRGR